MARTYWETIKKNWKKFAGGVGIPVVIFLFWFWAQAGMITITGHTGDMVCAGTESDPCIAEINFTVTANESIFLYRTNYDPWGRNVSMVGFDKPLRDWKMYRSWGDGWREIPLDEGCTGSWCGCYWCRKDNTAEYAMAFRPDRDYEIRIVGYKENPKEDIKWSFGTLDPVWYGTGASAPNKPTLNAPSPSGTIIFDKNATLNVTVTDPDGDIMNVSFYSNFSSGASYDASNGGGSIFSIYWDGSNYYVSTSLSRIEKYDSSWSYQTDYSYGTECTRGTSIYYNGSHWFLHCNYLDTPTPEPQVFVYDSSWNYESVSYNLSGMAINFSYGIYKSGNWFVTEVGNVYEYNSTWDKVATHDISSETSHAYGIYQDSDNNWWVADKNQDDIDKYDSSWNYLNSYNVISEPTGITYNSGTFWVSNTTETTVYEYFYSLGTSNSVSNNTEATATWSGLSNGTYSWYVNVTDGSSTTQSDIWNFTTGVLNLYLNGVSQDRYYDTLETVRIKANLTSGGTLLGSELFCLNIDSANFSTDFLCDDDTDGVLEYNYTAESSAHKFNDSSSETNLTYSSADNKTKYVRMHANDSIISSSIDLSGYDNTGYPHDPSILVNGTRTHSLYGDLGILGSSIINESDFNGSQSEITLGFERTGNALELNSPPTQREYIRVPSILNSTYASFNITGNPNSNVSSLLFPFVIYESGFYTVDWTANEEYGGYGYTHQGGCYAPTASFIGDKFWLIGGQCTNNDDYSSAYNLTGYYDISQDDMGTYNDELPYDMWGGCAVTHNDQGSQTIYIFGGSDSDNNPIASATSYDEISFTSITDMPTARLRPACSLVNDTVYIFGSDNGTMLEYNITSDSYSAGGDMGDDSFVSAQLAQYNSTHLVAWGGSGNFNIYWYDMTSDSFTDTGNNFARYGATEASLKKQDGTHEIFSIGGYYSDNGDYAEIYRFNPSTGDFDFYESRDTNLGYYCGHAFRDGELYEASSMSYGIGSALRKFQYYPQNPYVVVGSTNNNASWSYDGGYTAYSTIDSDMGGVNRREESTSDFSDNINDYIANNCEGSSYCDVPIYLISGSSGNLTIQDLNITWTANDIKLGSDTLQSYLDNSSGFTDLPITFESSNSGIIELSDLQIYYYGSDNVTVTADYGEISDSQDVRIVYSNFTIEKLFSDLLFYPKSKDDKNVTPRRQADTIPYWNITYPDVYHDQNIDVAFAFNESLDSCMNITVSTNNSKSDGVLLNTTKQTIGSNLTKTDFIENWFWLDLNNCSSGVYVPKLNVETCCASCVSCW